MCAGVAVAILFIIGKAYFSTESLPTLQRYNKYIEHILEFNIMKNQPVPTNCAIYERKEKQAKTNP